MRQPAGLCRLLLALTPASLSAASPARFIGHTIAADLKGGYQVVAADLNRDGKPDLIALASGMKELVWYENPGWQRHVIAGNMPGMINCAAWDIDGDGIPEIALASEFSMDASRSLGIITVLHHDGDSRGAWTSREIDRIPASHRLRWADIDGSGRKVLINSPLTGASARPPDYHGATPLILYRPGEWKRQLMGDAEEGIVHGIFITDWTGSGREGILAAGFSGIHLYLHTAEAGWTRTRIAKGDPSPPPKGGSSDVAVGRLGRRRYIAAIEPWHGNQAVIYHDRGGEWRRQVIDASLADGHTILTADLNRDGRDEVIAGFRGGRRGVFLFYAQDARGSRWSRRILDDGGIAAAGCAVADLNGDGRPDIACIGSATANLKWYENR